MKRWQVVGIVTLGVVAALVGGAVALMPQPGPERLVINDQIVGVRAGYSYAYLVHGGGRAVLIDAGSDATAAALRAELDRLNMKPSDVEAILLTHGHRDHWGGAVAFPRAVAWVGAEDHLLLRGDRLPRAPVAKLAGRLGGRPPVHPQIREVVPGMLLTFGDWTFEAVSVPGHTAGSTMYRLGDVLFAGDSLLVDGDGLDLPPRLFSDDPADNLRSLHRLKGIDFDILADGHVGVARDGRQRFERWLSAQD